MWLETGASELRVLNERYEYIVTHTRKYGSETEPTIDFENYIEALSRKPRTFLNSPYFPTLPETVQTHLKNLTYPKLKKTLLTIVPIIRDGKIGDAEAVLELVTIRTFDEFIAAYRALTEDTKPLPIVTKAKKIKAKTNLDFLLQLFNEELEERDRKRRNAYQKAAKFDIIKTFENYTFEDIKFPKSLTADDIMDCNFIPRRENLILYGNVGTGKTHLAIATGIAACDVRFGTNFLKKISTGRVFGVQRLS